MPVALSFAMLSQNHLYGVAIRMLEFFWRLFRRAMAPTLFCSVTQLIRRHRGDLTHLAHDRVNRGVLNKIPKFPTSIDDS